MTKTPLSNQIVDMLDDNQTLKVLNYVEEPAILKDEVIKAEAGAVMYSRAFRGQYVTKEISRN